MTLPPNRIEAVARAILALVPVGYGMTMEEALRYAAAADAALYPELANGKAWVAPIEATEAMQDAAAREEAERPSRHWEPYDAWAAMRNAFLQEPKDNAE